MSEILRKFKDCKCETYLVKEDNCTLLRCNVDGREYGFYVNWVPDKNIEWLAQVYSSNLVEMRDVTRKNAFDEVRSKITDFTSFLKDRRLI